MKPDVLKRTVTSPPTENLVLFSMILALLVIGLNILLASSSFLARQSYGDPFFFLKKQLLFAVIGFIIFLLAIRTDPELYSRFAWYLYGFSIVLLLMVFVPGIGKKAGGASRWLMVGGFSLQPSDIARFSMILLIARFFTDHKERSMGKMLLLLVLISAPIFLIAIEQDLGTALHIAITVGVMLTFTDFPLRMHFLIVGLSVVSLIYMVLYVPFRLERLKGFLDPWAHRYESAYQLVASLKSYLSGGIFGNGLGEGLRRHNLQARHTDFILAIVAEDLGAIGITLVLALYFGIAFYALFLLRRVDGTFLRLLGTGITFSLIFQVSINTAVTMGLMPTTGINLPLFSYGGTSLITYLFMLGVLLSVCKRARLA